MKQLKRVRMRKVHLENEYMNEDRWYCLKCLQSHEQSLSCLYCSQVYFIEEEVLEDEEKVWICCDKCDRWIHLECEIQTGKNSKLRHQDYDSESFRYSCPECKPSSTKKKTTKKEQRKAAKKGVKTKPEAAKKGRRNTGNSEVSGSVNDGEKAPKIPLRASVSQRRRSDLNSSSYSNSLDDVSQKDKNVVFESDAKMADESSEINNYVREDSQMCSNEESKRRSTELSSKNHSRETKENRRSNRTRKVKESKASKENMAKNRKNLKRNHEEYSQQDYSNERESVQELTLYRSLKIAREREDIVEARTLAPKVLQFCGLSPAQVAERVEKDLEIIMQHLAEDMKNDENLRDSFMGEFSQRDIYFNNPEKDTERGAYCTNSSMNLASSSFGGATNANEHGKSLRSRRTRTATSKNY